MKRFLSLALLIPLLFVISCTAKVQKITAEEAKTMMANDPSIVLVDVRTSEEFTAEHIPGAILLPLDNIAQDAKNVLRDKEGTYIIYCHTGNRSGQASDELVRMGYLHIYDMGGIIDWPYPTV